MCRKKKQDIFNCSNDGFLNSLINNVSAAEPSVHKITRSTYFKSDTPDDKGILLDAPQ